MEDIKQKIESLRKELHRHNYNYYVLSQPTVSDFQFDQLLKQLSSLEEEYPQFADPNSPTQRVGSDISKQFRQEKHRYPMLSLPNTYTRGEISDFYNRLKKDLNSDIELVCELKFDGASISLTFENGKLTRALTRGDGVAGDDVTANVRTIGSIPLVLQGENYPPLFEIRGEILMPWQVFDQLNAERANQEEPLFANPRNATSGTLKQQDPRVVAARHLDCYLYYIQGDNLPTESHYLNLQQARKWGFKISDATVKVSSLDEIFDYIDHWDTARKSFPVATDGIVIKLDSLPQQRTLGFTSKFPRWAIAYKFAPEQALTKLLSVSYQVGRTGAITPVANLEPALLSGTTVRRASLYNADAIQTLDLHEEDMVFVEKGGEIIPKITAVDADSRQPNAAPVKFIDNCPECGSPLIRYEGEAVYYCPNQEHCRPQLEGRIEHFITRKAMNIAGGSETVSQLFGAGLLHTVADLYTLQAKDLQKLERWGERSAQNLIESIRQSVNVPYERVLYALGIRFVGETVAKKLAQAFPAIDLLAKATLEQLMLVDEIGERIARSVIDFFAADENRQIVEKLKQHGLQFALAAEQIENRTSKLAGKNIVISGVFQQHSRDQYKEMIERNGGKNSGAISAKTSFILAGENMGPAKLEKAKQLGIKIMNEYEFLNILSDETNQQIHSN